MAAQSFSPSLAALAGSPQSTLARGELKASALNLAKA